VTVSELLTMFFPHLAGVCIEQVFQAGRSLRIRARTCTQRARLRVPKTSSMSYDLRVRENG
jgi:hypothetical protein